MDHGGNGVPARRSGNSCDDYHRPLIGGEYTLPRHFLVRVCSLAANAMLSITTIVLVMLVASAIVAAIVWRESVGH
jgi:hypothetical protein